MFRRCPTTGEGFGSPLRSEPGLVGGDPRAHRFGALGATEGEFRLTVLPPLPRAPALLAADEPETPTHPALIPPPAHGVVKASQRPQAWLTTHSTALADAIAVETGEPPSQLEKADGETRIVGQSNLERLVSIQ